MPKLPPEKKHYQGHRERLRKRFLDAPEKMHEYELLELLLGYVLVRKDTKPLAKELLTHFGSLRDLLDGKLEELRNIDGVGTGVEIYLRLVREVFVRYSESPIKKRRVLCTPKTLAIMAKKRLVQASAEEIWVAYVNTANHLISWEKISQGSVSRAALSPRDVLERALLLRASGFIMVHNHPAGTVKPSLADISLTNKLKEIAALMDVRFLDHIIVTETACYSIANEGLLD